MTAPPAMKSGKVFTNGVRPKVSKTKSWNQLSLVLSKVAVMARLEKKIEREKKNQITYLGNQFQVCLHFIVVLKAK